MSNLLYHMYMEVLVFSYLTIIIIVIIIILSIGRSLASILSTPLSCPPFFKSSSSSSCVVCPWAGSRHPPPPPLPVPSHPLHFHIPITPFPSFLLPFL